MPRPRKDEAFHRKKISVTLPPHQVEMLDRIVREQNEVSRIAGADLKHTRSSVVEKALRAYGAAQ